MVVSEEAIDGDAASRGSASTEADNDMTPSPRSDVLTPRPRSSSDGNPLSTQRRRLGRFSFLRHYRQKDKDSFEMKPVGFENLGNTCYMNSALQCLRATQLFCSYFARGMELSELEKNKNRGTYGALTKACRQVMKSGSTEDLKILKKAIEQRNHIFKGYSQHDAHELLTFLLDGIHEELNRADHHHRQFPEKDITSSVVEAVGLEHLAAAAWQTYLFNNKSFLVDLFQGQLVSEVRCLWCREFSLKFDSFMYLSLPVCRVGQPSKRLTTIEEALEEFSRKEVLEDARWKCPRCKREVPVQKKMQLVKLPPILIVHFKRFQYTESGFQKIEGLVKTPLVELDMAVYVKQKHSPVYDLYGVIDHTGHAECGHYTATCLIDGKWRVFDDTVISKTDSSEVNSSSNYVLFFQRRDVPQEPDLLRRQTLQRPEDWPHSLRSASIEAIKKSALSNT